ncbi:DUF6115 domain-containing protein [Bacillaceae bacterium W0354]
MDSIFIFISFVIHVITFIIIFLFYQKLQQATEGERNFERRVQEVEDLFNSYLLEIKDENRKFLEAITHIDSETQHNDHQTSDTQDILKKQQFSDKNVKYDYHIDKEAENNKKHKSSQKYKIENVSLNDQFERPSIQAQIMQLYSAGHSVEEIAKKLNKGNTEVELIVKFNQKMMN